MNAPAPYSPPPLARHEGSWAIVRLSDGQAMAELFRDSKAIASLNTAAYKAVPIGQHLASLNSQPA